MTYRFTATIYKFSSNPSFFCLDAPAEISRDFGKRAMIAVKGTVNGREWRGTLLPNASGGHRMVLNGRIRKQTRVGAGDTVEVSLEFDPVSRDAVMPAALEDALRENELLDAFNAMSRTRRNAALKWLEQAKTTATWERRVESLVMKLRNNTVADLW
jgi:Domain of unknown function (DUF1905)/Bacteriocin-protection, YdeI or OmpD-Associated